jgi:O-acetyl-ADP-ribose deacetylase (regulator of RNase III)
VIRFKQGNILEESAEALVNTVNCVGVMGKGVALQFKQAFPENFHKYKKACTAKEVEAGRMFIVSTGQLLFPRYIVNFPTKRHWKEKSQIADIRSGLAALIQDIQRLEIRSIAIPPLGCGNGGLDWQEVQPLIEEAFASLPEVEVIIFAPQEAPSQIKVNTPLPSMTRSRALFIKLLELYGIPGYELSKLEIQKLAYFLQEAGEPLKLRYVKHQFGPYADNLNHVLQRLEGHFIRGYGDRTQHSHISVLQTGIEAAQSFLAGQVDAQERLERVGNLIMGFETPYGMEMLATLHWVAKEDPEAAIDCDKAIQKVQEWSDRKQKLFQINHLQIAWHHLQEQGWLGSHPSATIDHLLTSQQAILENISNIQ